VFSQPRDGSLDLRQGPEQPLTGSLGSGGQVVIQEHDSDSGSYDEKGDAPDEVGECGSCDTPARGVVRPASVRSLYAKSSVGSSFPEMEESDSNGDEGSVASLIFEAMVFATRLSSRQYATSSRQSVAMGSAVGSSCHDSLGCGPHSLP